MIELIKALVPLAWPMLVAIIVWRLFPLVRGIAGSRAFSIEVGGMKVGVEAATEQLNARISDLQAQVIALKEGATPDADEPFAEPAPAAPAPVADTRPRRPIVLWVDDKPTNNAFEVAQFQQLGVEVLQATSTQDALAMIHANPGIGAIISDMGRKEDGRFVSRAGLALLTEVRKAGRDTPFLIYTSGLGLAQDRLESIAAGGSGATTSPTELLGWLRKTVL